MASIDSTSASKADKAVAATTGGAISISAFASFIGLCCIGPWTVALFGVSGAITMARWAPVMNKAMGIIIMPLALLLASCSPDAPVEISKSESLYSYITLTEDLAQLKADFNAANEKFRLVFVSGPSCGICLRGLDDLNRSIVESLQSDPRVYTFVIHVPTLGAEEKHVRASIPLMAGPRVSHYWDEEGNSGLEFQEALDISMYAWDVWMIYAPGQVWKIYIDSHTGDAFRQAMIGSEGEELLAIEFDNYRDVDGFRLPHEIQYFEDERLLAKDHFESVAVTVVDRLTEVGAEIESRR